MQHCNGDLEWPFSNIRTCLMNPYYKLYVYFLGPKILTEIETLKAKLEKGALGLLLADVALTVERGKTFWRVDRVSFFTKTAITQERKVEKLPPTWVMNGLSEGYKRAVDQNWGRMDFWTKERDFGPKKHSLLSSNHDLATTGKSCSKKKLPFSKINIRNFGCFMGIKRIFGQKNTCRPNVKTAVSL